MDQRIKGLQGLDPALSRPRWGTVLAVGAFGLAALWNARRLHDTESIVTTVGPWALAAGLISTALLVGISAAKEGTREDETWQAAFLYFFGALFLALPQAILA